MSRRVILSLGGLLIALVMGGLVYGSRPGRVQVAEANGPASFTPRPLLEASPEEVAQVAIAWTRAKYRIQSGTPDVRLSRSAKIAELPALGLPELHLTGEEPPLMLVVLRGDFDMQGMPGGGSVATGQPRPAEFVTYLFNLRTGVPMLTETLPPGQGGRYRKLLSDPSLTSGDPATPFPPSAPGPWGPPLPLATTPVPYGATPPPAILPPPAGR